MHAVSCGFQVRGMAYQGLMHQYLSIPDEELIQNQGMIFGIVLLAALEEECSTMYA
jgi:hypothetical protein